MKKKFGDMKIKEIVKTCKEHPKCKQCPLEEVCSYFTIPEDYNVDKEVLL